MAFDLAHINHYLLIHRPLGFSSPPSIQINIAELSCECGLGYSSKWQFFQPSAPLSLSLSLSFSLHVLNPPLVTSHGAAICAVIRPSPACRLGRNIIKTILCCHGNRDLNKFIFFMFFFFSFCFLKIAWHLVGWLTEWQSYKLFFLSVFSSHFC